MCLPPVALYSSGCKWQVKKGENIETLTISGINIDWECAASREEELELKGGEE
jgi:hypothetical protein